MIAKSVTMGMVTGWGRANTLAAIRQVRRGCSSADASTVFIDQLSASRVQPPRPWDMSAVSEKWSPHTSQRKRYCPSWGSPPIASPDSRASPSAVPGCAVSPTRESTPRFISSAARRSAWMRSSGERNAWVDSSRHSAQDMLLVAVPLQIDVGTLNELGAPDAKGLHDVPGDLLALMWRFAFLQHHLQLDERAKALDIVEMDPRPVEEVKPALLANAP